MNAPYTLPVTSLAPPGHSGGTARCAGPGAKTARVCRARSENGPGGRTVTGRGRDSKTRESHRSRAESWASPDPCSPDQPQRPRIPSSAVDWPGKGRGSDRTIAGIVRSCRSHAATDIRAVPPRLFLAPSCSGDSGVAKNDSLLTRLRRGSFASPLLRWPYTLTLHRCGPMAAMRPSIRARAGPDMPVRSREDKKPGGQRGRSDRSGLSACSLRCRVACDPGRHARLALFPK